MNVLIWHVHGSWTTNFVAGRHTYVVPVLPGRGEDGRGRAATWDWPPSVVETTPAELADRQVDVIVVQRPRDLALARAWLGGRVPGRDVPVVWLEHNAPQGRIAEMVHPARGREDVSAVVHVTHTNALMWDTGSTPARVIEHGVAEPAPRWSGDERSVGVVVNEPVRRGRVTGTDLLPRFGARAPVDVFGMRADDLNGHLGRPTWLSTYDDLPQRELHLALARRRCYLHPYRWTSLGLSLIEAMLMGMPVVALATTETPDAVPPECGIVSNDVDRLVAAAARLMQDETWAADLGAAARCRARDRYSLGRFLAEWDELLETIA